MNPRSSGTEQEAWIPTYTGRKEVRAVAQGDKRIAYRDSKTGEFITRREAERKNPATWERQHIPKPGKGK